MGDGEQKKLPAVSPNHSGETLQDVGGVLKEHVSTIPDVTEQVKSIDFVCGAEVCSVDSAHHFLQWQADGQGVPIPVSKQVIGNLSDVFGPSLDPGTNVVLSGSLTFRLPIEDFDVASAIVQHLRIPTPMNNLPSREHAMKIGTALLQLPVEGGHQDYDW